MGVIGLAMMIFLHSYLIIPVITIIFFFINFYCVFAQETHLVPFHDLPQESVDTMQNDRLLEPMLEEKKPPSEFILPPIATLLPKEGMLSGVIRVYVDSYKFKGNTVIPENALSNISKPYTKRVVSSDELQELRNKLTRFYIGKGYITSGVILPDQKIENGVITFQVIEGSVRKIEISGNKNLATSFIEERLALGAKTPLKVQTLQEQIQRIHQYRDIRKLDVEIKPGLKLGESDLYAKIYENKPYKFGFEFNNHRPPSVGSYQGEMFGEYHNLTSYGDTIGAKFGLTEGLDNYFVYYRIPINKWDTELILSYEKSDSMVVEEPFDEIDINSKSETYHVSIKQPLLKKPEKELNAELVFEHRRNKNYLLDEAFSFSPGEQDGESVVSPFRFALDWWNRSQNQVFAARSTFSEGTYLLGATKNRNMPDGEFFKWVGQVQLIRRFEKLNQSQIIIRMDIQLSGNELLPMEKFSVGGAKSVRGYRENSLVRDSGALASVEMCVPVIRLPIACLSKSIFDGMLWGAVFYDWGWSENKNERAGEKSETIDSAGLGVRWSLSQNIYGQIYWGHALTIFNQKKSDLQDSGIHFQIKCTF